MGGGGGGGGGGGVRKGEGCGERGVWEGGEEREGSVGEGKGEGGGGGGRG